MSIYANRGESLIYPIASGMASFHEQAWLSKGLVCQLHGAQENFVAEGQVMRLRSLAEKAKWATENNPNPMGLFPSENELYLGERTLVSSGLSNKYDVSESESVLSQLLPYWIEQAEGSSALAKSNIWPQVMLGSLEVASGHQSLIERIRLAQRRIGSLTNSRVSQFSRSAHYMGSKVALAPFLAEILHTFIPQETIVLDLMCGSGAAAGAFSRSWRTLASDAQQFSRLLGIVQGGGMEPEHAQSIANRVLSVARKHFEEMPSFLKENIQLESDFLASELTEDVVNELFEWIKAYPRVGNMQATSKSPFVDAIQHRRMNANAQPYILFSSYYGNLFFGVRQAAEIDSLRFAIEQLEDLNERSWALGALVCAVSSCAYSYGGHFAQPKFDGSAKARLDFLAQDMLTKRGLSVSHEFVIRLTNLAVESAEAQFPVEAIEGPWENALTAAAEVAQGAPICVYLDPPYTRDEYSRYYHVLETLVRYDYPLVQDKPSIPKRGDGGRFASRFATRNTPQIENLLAQIINECFKRKWSCLWSYSNTGVASIHNVLEQVLPQTGQFDIFCMDHAYKAQGRHQAKSVKEYAFFLRPN